ncbi:MAG: hypothetical protein IPJ56_04670 [Gemmatimonadetes bacterium]|nr:hypothetical protein [Gemmatimonadota bacterium]
MHDDELERLFKLYHTPLVRYLTRRLGDRDWAEEVAQETFLRALRQDALTSERSWLSPSPPTSCETKPARTTADAATCNCSQPRSGSGWWSRRM